MHLRHLGTVTPPSVPGVDPFEALLLGVASLRLSTLPPSPQTLADAVELAPGWLSNLLRMEPDFFDQLLLGASLRYVRQPELRESVSRQIAVLREAGPALHEPAAEVLGHRRTVGAVLRGLVGAGPDLARSPWVRWTRSILVLSLLDAKG